MLRLPRLASTLILPALWAGMCLTSTAQDPAQTAQLLNQGSDAAKRGDLPAAESIFRRATLLAPTLSDAFLGLGLVELRRGLPDQAVLALARAAALNPQLQGPHLYLGIAQFQIGQATEATASLHAELALDPNSLEALRWLGIVELSSDHPAEAAAALDHAAALAPSDPDLLYYRARAHASVAESALQQLYRLDPDSALVHRAQAENFATSGQPEKAIAEFQAALRKQPANPDLLDSLGEQQQKLSRFDDAARTYQAELGTDPHSPIALYNLGKIDVEQGRPQQGVAHLRLAQAAHARPAPTDFYLGLALAELGETTEAAHWLEQSLASSPSPFIEQGACFQLARVYQRLGRKDEADRLLARLKQLKAQATAEASSASPSAPATGEPITAAPPGHR